MQKTRDSRPVWVYVVLTVLLILLFFSNDFGLVDIQRTAIVTSVGIDTDGDGYLVTALTDVPKDTQSVNSVPLSGSGATVAEALADVNAKTGWYPKLVFCNLIVLGEEVAKRDVFCVLDFFLRNEYAQDTALLALCNGRAYEFLSGNSPLSDVTSESIRTVLSVEGERAGRVTPVRLKDFALGYYSHSQSGYMPYLSIVKTDRGNLFTAERTALFYRGIQCAILTEEQTRALATVKNKLRWAIVPSKVNGEVYTLALAEGKQSVGLTVKDSLAYATVSIRGRVRVRDTNETEGLFRITAPALVEDDVVNGAEAYLAEKITEVYEVATMHNCDVFGLKDQLKRKNRRYYAAYCKDLLQKATFSAKIDFYGEK